MSAEVPRVSLRQSESRNCRLYVFIYSEQWSYAIGESMATWKTRISKSNEKRSLIPWALGYRFRRKIFILRFTDFCATTMKRNITDYHVFTRVAWQLIGTGDWFRWHFFQRLEDVRVKITERPVEQTTAEHRIVILWHTPEIHVIYLQIHH